jgi:hypothetical protein
MGNNSPEVKTSGVENSVIGVREIADSALDEAIKLRAALEVVLVPSEPQKTANEKKQPHAVKVVADLDACADVMREARYIYRDIMDRLAL